MSETPDEIIQAVSFLRGHLSGLIRFDTEYLPIRIVVAPDGRLAAPVMESMLMSTDCAIYLPEEPEDRDDDVIQLMVTLERFEENGPEGVLADRWRIYHGEPEDVRWATMTIDFCKFGELAFDGEALMWPNPLADDEAGLCRRINRDREAALRDLVLRIHEVEIEEPRLVGVDGLGIDVRGRFDVLRVGFDSPVVDAAGAEAAIDSILDSTA